MHLDLLNATDIVFIAIVLVSTALAFMRGLVREALALAAWVGAVFVTIYCFGLLQPYMRDWIGIGMLADGLAAVALFVAGLMLVSFAARRMSGVVKESALSGTDRLLGAIFGAARGALIVVLLYLAAAWVWPPAEQPDWLRNARTIGLVEDGARVLQSLMPQEKIPGASPPAPDGEKGYNDSERDQLDRVLKDL